MDVYFLPVSKLQKGDVLWFAGQQETVESVVQNVGRTGFRNIHLKGIKTPLVERATAEISVLR